MSISKTQLFVLRVADAAYHAGRGRLVESLPRGRRRDSLADFLAGELREVSNGSSEQHALKKAIDLLDQRIHELTVVRYEMDYAVRRLN